MKHWIMAYWTYLIMDSINFNTMNFIKQNLAEALNYLDATNGRTASDDTNICVIMDLPNQIIEKLEE